MSVCLNLSVGRMTGRLEGPEQREESSRRLRALPTNTKTGFYFNVGTGGLGTRIAHDQ